MSSGEPVVELPNCMNWGRYDTMVCTIPTSAWTWFVRSRKASAVTTNEAGLDVGEGNPGCRGFYSKGYEASVPEVLTAPVAYHAIVLRRSLYGPCGKARSVLLATGERRSCPPYPRQVDRTTADPPMLMSGRLQSRRVSHIVGPTVREHRNMVGGAGDVHVVSIRRVRYRAQFHVRELAEQHHPPSLVITSDRHTGGFFKLVLWTNLRWWSIPQSHF
ncbi:hypothetical protein B296_00040690 [Ensete ventricosum]|uniref:Uncharacterized protein n=1 Tax=Ensete ventricosum TaxID=4639 RepID=A0A426XHL2_ENSVE|nr:hypothetical protein B296_00040690 [Ensete ventricosum]